MEQMKTQTTPAVTTLEEDNQKKIAARYNSM
jgi:hypothetical protein